MEKKQWMEGFFIRSISAEEAENFLRESPAPDGENMGVWNREWAKGFLELFHRQEVHFLLLFWQEQEEKCFFFFSDTKQIRALEFLEYLFPDVGLVRGDGTFAMSHINDVVINLLLAQQEEVTLEEYLRGKSQSYFADSDWIEAAGYAKKHPEVIKTLRRYRKKKIPWAYVKTTDIAPVGTDLSLKSLENESGLVITADWDTYIMIGCRGEVYHINRETFERTYEETRESLDVFARMMEFIPELVILPGQEYVSLEEHAHLCYPGEGAGIYAKKLERRTKVFPAGGIREYYLGRPGDYLAVRREDLQDIYVIQGDIFEETYEEQEDGSQPDYEIPEDSFESHGILEDDLQLDYEIPEDGFESHGHLEDGSRPDDQKHSVLFLHGEAFCYDSLNSFYNSISEEFQKVGWSTHHVFCTKQDGVAPLRELYGQEYDILFDINSHIPSLRDQDGQLCLNRIGGQVWHYILDHPFYHHSVLHCELNHFSVICLDEKHRECIQECYPHIQRVLCLPLGTKQAERIIPYPQRQNDLLFTGTYTDSALLLYGAGTLPAKNKTMFEKVAQLLINQPELTQEEALFHFFNKEECIYLLQNKCQDMSALEGGERYTLEEYLGIFTLSDMYLRALVREECLFHLLKRGITLTVYGHNWEYFVQNCMSKIPDTKKHLRLKGEISYDELPQIYADSKIALNVLPWFKAGMHDRIPMALMNGCVCVTDESSYLGEHFIDGEELYCYSIEEPEEMAQMVEEIQKQPSAAVKTAARGYAHGVKCLSWRKWVEDFLTQYLS